MSVKLLIHAKCVCAALLFVLKKLKFKGGERGHVAIGCRFGLILAAESTVLFHQNCRFVYCIFDILNQNGRFWANFD